MEQGIVKFFNNKKGFGFIIRPNGKDIFVHWSSIKMEGYKTLEEKSKVQYKVIETEKGLQAVEVSVVG